MKLTSDTDEREQVERGRERQEYAENILTASVEIALVEIVDELLVSLPRVCESILVVLLD
jgi:hypothetical protein